SLSPLQLGVGVSGGCEAAIHATRRFISHMTPDQVVVKLDFANAFNRIHRDAILLTIANTIPEIYRFCHLVYYQSSMLQFGDQVIFSQEGVQQGDPLGPLLFCITVQPLLKSLTSSLKMGYMDDVTIGGSIATVAADVSTIRHGGALLGLQLNAHKCEIISNHISISNPQFDNFIRLSSDTATLLGAPLSTGSALHSALTTLCNNLERAVDRLQLISAHDALVLLKNCLGGPKLQYVLRTTPCHDHPLLLQFDNLLRTAVSKICNVSLSDDQWAQASLPVSKGGLGVRSVSKLASSAFLASAASTLPLQSLILGRSEADKEDMSQSIDNWKKLSGMVDVNLLPETKQKSLDTAVATHEFNNLVETHSGHYHRARLIAAAAPHSGDWLHALPISACGLRLSDEAVRVAVGLRLGTAICQTHSCSCGSPIDQLGTHAFSCKHNPGRSQRHHFLNDMIWHALSKAGVPSLKEPHGLSRTDGKRPDGLTLIPWHEGRSATWDVTVTNTVATSYLPLSSVSAAAAAENAAQRKEIKYAEIMKTHLFYPLAFETLGPINRAGHEFLSELGHRISTVTDDPRETSFLYQRIAVSVQKFNAICFAYAFEHEHNFFDQQ
ncbi:MAG TPA: reverse transcriptase domain-containing protein, partial [Methylomicrobium sp.]|nr:reverse transcriptase domain-containing protein [Methylomicrobium sp.]